MEQDFAQSIRGLEQVYSVNLSVFDDEFLRKSFIRSSTQTGIQQPSLYLEHLKTDAQAAESYFRSLYITYTQFFRDPLLFAYLEHRVIPNLIHQMKEDGEIRVWSAGCATGQEAYSLAMLFDEQLKTTKKGIRLRIFATDVSEHALAIANKGVYAAFDMQNVRFKQVQAYFIESGGQYTVTSEIRSPISFSRYDLLEAGSENPPDSIFGNFDLVCCNNLLMYYKKEIRMSMLQKIERSLAPTGVLTVSEAERAFIKNSTDFQPVSTPVAVFHKPNFPV